MKKIIFFILLCYHYSWSQKYYVVDSLNNRPIPYAHIKFGNEGIYANEDGGFINPLKINHPLEISCVGYNSKIISNKYVGDTIFLNPKIFELDEFVIRAKRKKSILIGLSKKRSDYGTHLFPKTEIVALIKPQIDYENMLIQKAHFPITKSYSKKLLEEIKTTKKDLIGVLRINIYDVSKNSLPDTLLFSSEPIKYSINKDKIINLDISSEYLKLPKNGLAFGIEMIGRVDDKGNIIPDTNPYLVLKFTKKETDEFWSTTFYKSAFEDTNRLIPVSELYQNDKMIDRKLYKLAIGLTVSENEN